MFFGSIFVLGEVAGATCGCIDSPLFLFGSLKVSFYMPLDVLWCLGASFKISWVLFGSALGAFVASREVVWVPLVRLVGSFCCSSGLLDCFWALWKDFSHFLEIVSNFVCIWPRLRGKPGGMRGAIELRSLPTQGGLRVASVE